MSTGYDPILFDLDGTVIDTVSLIRESHRHAVRTVLGADLPDEELVAHVGRPLIEQMRIFSAEHADELYEVYREWNHANTAAMIRPYAGIEGLLERLRAGGRRLGIVTSKSRDAVDLAFAAIAVESHFEVVLTSDDTARHKPDPGPLLQAAEMLGANGARVCYVGDAPYDLQAARAAGMDGIAVTWGFFPERDLAAEQPTTIARTVAELERLLLG